MRKDLTGKKFNRLTAIRYVGKDNGGRALWLFKCDCGIEKVIQGYSVSSGKTISCGCYHKQITSKISSKDCTGERFGKLVALKRIRDREHEVTYYICRCDCGNIVKVRAGNLCRGDTKSCGCSKKSIYYDENLVGKKFGRLQVISEEHSKNKGLIEKCKCMCGNITYVTKHNLVNGNTKSCGCLHRDVTRELLSTHKLSNTALYKKFAKMIERCENPNSKAYKNYGGRGIKICDEWRNDFTSFYNWSMSNGYKEDLTIERIDVNGNYCPENCKWIPLKEQAKNKTNTIRITYKNETHILADWARITGLNPQTIRNRLNKYGYDDLDNVIKYKGVQ